ncbi:MAG: DUF5655 domain-containing protein [Melioribacteraceae bacterium]|nr:DUF5655 domain-containing protein [Melioribacteraceae bacterium]
MSDIKLFQIKNSSVTELEGKSVQIEKSLQTLIEKNLDVFLGITFLESEYSTGIKHKGRIDTLGIDENNCPVIIEYKRATNENVINQGLFYLDWLLDHKETFQLLVQNKIDKSTSEAIEWNSSRLICIAGDYTKYDTYAVEQINRNIELYRYKKFDDILLLELVNSVSSSSKETKINSKSQNSKTQPPVADFLLKCSPQLQDLYNSIKDYLFNLGSDVSLKELERYFAFKKIKTFCSMKFQPQTNTIVLWLRIDPNTIKLEKGFTKDVSKVGHHGIGSLEVRLRSYTDFEKAKPLILKSYEQN